MKWILFLVLSILAANVIVNRASAGSTNGKPSRTQTSRPDNDRTAQTPSIPGDVRILRVTSRNDAAKALVPDPSIQSVNLDATRFYIDLDGVLTLYSFDLATLSFHKQGRLFPETQMDLVDPSWSAVNPDLLYGLDSAGLPKIWAYNVKTRSLTVARDFSAQFSTGETGKLSKSRRDDDHFSFAWRESKESDWRYVTAWNRVSDSVFMFDLKDGSSGLKGYTR